MQGYPIVGKDTPHLIHLSTHLPTHPSSAGVLSACNLHAQCLWRSGDGVRSPGTGVVGGCEPSLVPRGI